MTAPHVLVLIDASPASRMALASAARLARQQHGELIALFVEDQDLHASAGHPFTREISRLSGESRPFDRETLLTRLAQQRHQIEAMLSELDRDTPLRWHLEVVAGPVFESVRAAAETADWVVLGKAGWSAGHGARLGSVARRLLESGGNRLFLWQAIDHESHRWRGSEQRLSRLRGPSRPTAPPSADQQAAVVGLLLSQRTAEAVVQTAEIIATVTDRPCHLFLLTGIDPATLPSLTAWRQAGDPPLIVELIEAAPERHDSSVDPALFRNLQQTAASVVVLSDDAGAVLGRPLTDLIADIPAPVIRVPSPPA
ncbi:MAG: universal stress protein [Guyparkeria sp.]|uniref:universal stress protein n=1 Tax=Guyparkeria sp. TaxID=2035736 RepID=UPI0039783E40